MQKTISILAISLFTTLFMSGEIQARSYQINSGTIKPGGKGDFSPAGVLIDNNLYYKPASEILDDLTGNETFSENVFQDAKALVQQGFSPTGIKFMKNESGYFQTEKNIPTKKAAIQILDIPEQNEDPQILLDIERNKRAEKLKSAGCFEPGKEAISVKFYATELNTGPEYLQEKHRLAKLVIENVRKETLLRANEMLNEKPVTVSASSCKRSAGGKHDFYSEGDYWWPDPANPTGPYIQKDGQTNPENFVEHRLSMIRLSDITATLTSAWLITGEKKYADQAEQHLNAWFADTTTMMNPNMLYAQAIWGRFTGRGIGLIDAYHLVEVAQSAKVLIDNKAISQNDAEKIKSWFSSFLNWMTTHKYGTDEMNAKNNHGTCWAVSASAMAKLTNNEEVQKMCIDRFKTVFLTLQMAGDGSFPLELKRTKPYGYSLFNIDAMCNLAEILSTPEDNLFDFKTPDGKSLRKGMEFIYPFIADKSKWPFAHDIYIWDEWPVRQSSLLFSGLAFNNNDYIKTYLNLPANPTHPEVIRNLPVRHPVIWLMK